MRRLGHDISNGFNDVFAVVLTMVYTNSIAHRPQSVGISFNWDIAWWLVIWFGAQIM